MRATRMLSSVATGVAVAASVLGGAGQAHADAYAPYAQAAAEVNANGTVVLKTQSVVKVTRVSAGDYCIELDPEIDRANSIPMATLRRSATWRSEIYVDRAGTGCPVPANSVRVLTGTNGTATDQPFLVVIP